MAFDLTSWRTEEGKYVVVFDESAGAAASESLISRDSTLQHLAIHKIALWCVSGKVGLTDGSASPKLIASVMSGDNSACAVSQTWDWDCDPLVTEDSTATICITCIGCFGGMVKYSKG